MLAVGAVMLLRQSNNRDIGGNKREILGNKGEVHSNKGDSTTDEKREKRSKKKWIKITDRLGSSELRLPLSPFH